MSHELLFDPFTAEDIVTLPEYKEDSTQTWHGFQIDENLQTGLLKLANPVATRLDSLQADHLKLSLDNAELPRIDPSPPSSPQSADTKDAEEQFKEANLDEDEDVWKCSDLYEPLRKTGLITWDHFLNKNHTPTKTAYLSELGPLVFDSWLRKSTGGGSTLRQLQYAKPDKLLNALFDVGLGRGSGFFEWNDTAGKFEKRNNDYTISGVSPDMLNQIIDTFLAAGTKHRQITTLKTTPTGRGLLALPFTSTVQDVLSAMELFVLEKGCQKSSLLQLQAVFRRPFQLLDPIYQMVRILKQPADAAQQTHDIFDLVETLMSADIELGSLIAQLTSKIVQPSLRAISLKIGILPSDISSEQKNVSGLDQLLPRSIVHLIESACTALALLERVDPEDVQSLRRLAGGQQLNIYHSWQEISQHQDEVNGYERTAGKAVIGTDDISDTPVTNTLMTLPLREVKGVVENEHAFGFNVDLFDQVPSTLGECAKHTYNHFHTEIYSFLKEESEPISSIQLSYQNSLEFSLLPLVTAQHRLLSYMAIKSLFVRNDLRIHLDSLFRFQFMADGVFTARLSTALFDSSQNSSGGKRKTNLTSGLRLQSRDVWPPASSELRLVLTGILAESMSGVQSKAVTEATSFAIRDLPDDELERCRDLSSIYALDFLRLHYKPANPILESIITPKSLQKYDRTFMYLMRLLRVKDLSQHLLRQVCSKNTKATYLPIELRLRREIHHFTSALANYSHEIAIKTHWHIFELKLQAIQHQLNQNDYEGTLKVAGSIEHIRNMHKVTLNDISHSLLLQKKQSEARVVIEDIFGLILRYAATTSFSAKKSTNANASAEDKTTQALTEIHNEFSTKIRNLLSYLSVSASASDQTIMEDDDSKPVNLTGQLLLALDYGGYYTKVRRR